MSGGDWDYLYIHVDNAADRLKADKDPLRRAFGEHLAKVAQALHDIEWVDSCDMSKGDDVAAIQAALGKDANAVELEVLSEDARRIIERIKRLLVEIEGKQ